MTDWICTACGYRGPKRTISQRQGCLLVLSLFVFVIPAIIYWVYLYTWLRRCPKCDQVSLVPTDSPRGEELAKGTPKDRGREGSTS